MPKNSPFGRVRIEKMVIFVSERPVQNTLPESAPGKESARYPHKPPTATKRTPMKKHLKTLLSGLLFVCLFAAAAEARPHPENRMSDREFSILYRRVKEKSFKDDRFELIEIGSLDSRFDTAQCLQLLELFDFDDDRLRALAFLAPHLVDRRGADRLLDCFTFESSRKQAAKLLLDR